jgi:hypothetical protein
MPYPYPEELRFQRRARMMRIMITRRWFRLNFIY